MSAEENKALVRRVFEELDRQNLGVLDETLVPDYVHHDPALPSDMQRGRDNYRQGTAMFYTAFPDLQGTIEDMLDLGDKVASRLRWRGTHQAELMGIPPTGKRIAAAGTAIMRFEGGKLAEEWVVFDLMSMMRQLGVIPPPEQGAGQATG